MRVYLDNAATTAIDEEVIAAMSEVLKNISGNPSSTHTEGRQAKTFIEKARKSIAALLEVAPGEIFFTSGGTEADNMALCCAVRDLGVNHIITSPIEHHAVLHSVDDCVKRGARVDYVKILPDGHIDIESLEHHLQNRAEGCITLVSLMHANNEIGNLLDIARVGELCRQYNAYFHSDTVQTMAHLPLRLKEWGVHFCTASAHKFHGPKGVGFIYISDSVRISPFICGGAQERNMRGGTENIYGIVGMAKAMEIAYAELDEQASRIQSLKNRLKNAIEREVPGVKFNGDAAGKSLFTVLNVSFPPSEAADMLLFYLDIEGVSASGGSACSSGSEAGSHVLAELPQRPGYSNVRFSFGKYNTEEEIDLVVSKLKDILKVASGNVAV